MSHTLSTMITALLMCAPFGLAGGYLFTYAQSIQDKHIQRCEQPSRFPRMFSHQDLHSPQRVAEIRLGGFLLLSLSVFIFFITLSERLSLEEPASRHTRPASASPTLSR